MVGGATIYTLGFSSGARLPLFGNSSGGWNVGSLVLFQLDNTGTVIETKTVKPFGALIYAIVARINTKMVRQGFDPGRYSSLPAGFQKRRNGQGS